MRMSWCTPLGNQYYRNYQPRRKQFLCGSTLHLRCTPWDLHCHPVNTNTKLVCKQSHQRYSAIYNSGSSRKKYKQYYYRNKTKNKFANVIPNPFLRIESPSLYMISIVCIFPEKELNKLLLSIVNVSREEVKIIKGYIMAYLTPAQYDLFVTGENNQKV